MVQTKEEMFLAEMGISPKTIIEGDYTAKYKLKDLLKKYAEQCNIADVVRQSEQLGDCNFCNNKAVKRDEDGFEFCAKCMEA